MEELKLILQTVAQLGEAGKDAFFWYLLLDRGLSFISFMGGLTLILWIAKSCFRAFSASGSLESLRDLMGVGCPGVVSDEDFLQMRKWIVSHKESGGHD